MLRFSASLRGRGGESSLFGEYADDPAGFASDILGLELWAMQQAIALAVRDNQRVAVASCFAAGKTLLAAVLVVWWICTREPALVISTAPTGRQVRGLLWREIKKLWKRARRKLPGKPLTEKWEIAADRLAIGFSAGNPVGAQGYHEKNTLVIEDEASGIEADLSKTLEGAMVSPECRRLKIGNPEALDGPFWDVFEGQAAGGWKTFHIGAFDTPNLAGLQDEFDACGATAQKLDLLRAAPIVIQGLVSGPWVAQQFLEFGEDSNWWRTKVLGLFPKDSVERLIPMEWIRASQALWREIEDGQSPRVLGADVARGKDKTAIAKRFGQRIHMGRAWQEPDTMRTVAQIVKDIEGDGMDEANIDETAVGGGIVDRVKEIQREGRIKGCRVRGCNLSSNARRKTKFFRLADELWWQVRQALNPDRTVNPTPIALPPDEELATQLNCRTYGTDRQNRVKVETKNELRRRGVKSPDKADAVALTLHKPKELAVA